MQMCTLPGEPAKQRRKVVKTMQPCRNCGGPKDVRVRGGRLCSVCIAHRAALKLCPECGAERKRGQNICTACRRAHEEAYLAPRRKPCIRCGGVKERGANRRLCDRCRGEAEDVRLYHSWCAKCGDPKPPGP